MPKPSDAELREMRKYVRAWLDGDDRRGMFNLVHAIHGDSALEDLLTQFGQRVRDEATKAERERLTTDVQSYFDGLHSLFDRKPIAMTAGEWHQRVNGMHSAAANIILRLNGTITDEKLAAAIRAGEGG